MTRGGSHFAGRALFASPAKSRNALYGKRRLAIAIIKERNVESDVLIQWMAVLRRSFPPGPERTSSRSPGS